MVKKSWEETIKPYIKKISKQSNVIFVEFNAEKKRLNIKNIYESNALWNKKYKPRLAIIEKRQDREYKRIWNKYRKSGGSFK